MSRMFKSVNKLCRQQLYYETIKKSVRLFSKQNVKKTIGSTPISSNPNVPGLSNKCLTVPKQPVGPNASKDKEYKNPEYFCYHVLSFAEAEVELAKFRLPVPSNKK